MRLLFEFEGEYVGPASYIPGNALRHALSEQINTSVGRFTYDSNLKIPQTYYEFFLPRTKKCFLHPYFERWYDRAKYQPACRCFFLPEYVTFDVIEPPEDLIKKINEKDLIQFGGKRNTGCGMVSLRNYIKIDLSKLKLPESSSHLTLLSPIIYLPPSAEFYECRHQTLKLWNHNKVNVIRAVAPGQFFRIKPNKNIPKIAKRGIIRKTPLGQFGFGEYILHDWKNNSGFVEYA